MSKNIFQGLFDTEFTVLISWQNFLICVGMAILLGIVIALTYMFKNQYTKSFVITLAMLPASVCVVIMMVNGQIGIGVAVAGAFSLVRFRSAPGTAKEIGMIFLSMGSGLIVGVGYLAYAALFTVIMCLLFILYNAIGFKAKKSGARQKELRITIPEDLDYSNVFDDILDEYAKSYELVRVKTTNMGSMFKLTYHITLRNPEKEKEMIDKLRVRNGNLEVSVSRQDALDAQL